MVVEWGRYRTKNTIENALNKFPESLTKFIKEVKEHPEKHEELAKAYKLFTNLEVVISNITEELDKETRKQKAKT